MGAFTEYSRSAAIDAQYGGVEGGIHQLSYTGEDDVSVQTLPPVFCLSFGDGTLT